DNSLVQSIAAFFTDPDETVQLLGLTCSLDNKGPRSIGSPGGMGNIGRLEKQDPSLQKRKLRFAILSKIRTIELPLYVVQELISRGGVKNLGRVRTAGNKSDKVRILPDDSALAPVATIFVNPLLKIETLEVRKHGTSLLVEASIGS